MRYKRAYLLLFSRISYAIETIEKIKVATKEIQDGLKILYAAQTDAEEAAISLQRKKKAEL